MKRWERTYWVVFAANLITAVGMMSFLPFFPTFLRELGVEGEAAVKTWTGVAFGAAPFSAALMGPIWGALGDRFGRKMMVLRALLAITLFVGCMGFVTTPLQLVVLRLCQGVFSGFVPPSVTLVSVAAPEARQGRVVGSLQASLAAGSIIGPLLGAWVQAHWGFRMVFAVVAAASALAALLVGLFAHEEVSQRQTLAGFAPLSILVDVGRDLRGILARPRIRAAIVILFAVQIGIGATNPQLLLFVEDLSEVPTGTLEERTAWLHTALSCAALVSTAAWGRLADIRGHGRVLTGAALLSGVVLLGHGVVQSYGSLFFLRIVLGLVATGANVAAFGLAATDTKNEERGGAMGAVFSARTMAVSCGSMLGGVVAGSLGIRGLFLISGALVLIILGALSRRTIRPRSAGRRRRYLPGSTAQSPLDAGGEAPANDEAEK
ncbi:MAG: DHA1 family multidrug resistance protein-like MFS transporter [Planctomycetota bacterium]|jgi:DHA1 family multidrug resistance protein-like MFS transporter